MACWMASSSAWSRGRPDQHSATETPWGSIGAFREGITLPAPRPSRHLTVQK
jgi:hypothetical protein